MCGAGSTIGALASASSPNAFSCAGSTAMRLPGSGGTVSLNGLSSLIFGRLGRLSEQPPMSVLAASAASPPRIAALRGATRRHIQPSRTDLRVLSEQVGTGFPTRSTINKERQMFRDPLEPERL
jgi:hypothetical protein